MITFIFKVWALNKGNCVKSFYGHKSETTCLNYFC